MTKNSFVAEVTFTGVLETNKIFTGNISQQMYVGLQNAFSITVFRLSRRLEDISQDFFKTCLELAFKTSLRRLETNKMFTGDICI